MNGVKLHSTITAAGLAVSVFAGVASCGFSVSGDVAAPADGGSGGADDGAANADSFGPSTGDSSCSLNVVDGEVLGPDGGPPITPSHVPPGTSIDPNAPDLANVTAINTSTRTITLSNAGVPPAGLRFERIGGMAVLFVKKWLVNVDVAVAGADPLIVLAASSVEVRAAVRASAVSTTPGPGGFGPTLGSGAGGSAVPSGSDDPGGGGAGFGAAGARGGNGSGTTGGQGGGMYGGALTDMLTGGSGGGHGSPFNRAPCTNGEGSGGAGGGAVQITSAASIDITSTGTINVSGGGGRGGCINGDANTMSGGGGGSGGTIFLEAPSIAVSGVLASNGGAGGGGAQVSTGITGMNGGDGQASLTAAQGGSGSGPERRGGNGGTRNAPATQPSAGVNNAGGGGAGVGRIWLRSRAAATSPAPTSTVTPAPMIDATL